MAGKRQIGLSSAALLVVANMIGVGVFTTSGFLLGDLGSPWLVLLAWVVGGGMATMGALSYGALARRIPESGGEYTFLSRTLHPAAGYVAGWLSLLVGFSAPLAAAALAFGTYTAPWTPGVLPEISGTVLLVAFALVHGWHVVRGARIQDLAVAFKIALILAFVIWAFPRLDLPPFTLSAGSDASSGFPVAAFGVSLVWISFSYSGWNAATYIGGEVQEPDRNLPRALLFGTVAVTGLYVVLNAVFVFAAPAEAVVGRPDVGRIAAAALGGDRVGDVVAFVISLALLTSVSSMTMAGPRVYARMAADGYFPRMLVNSEGPPSRAVALQCFLALVMLWSATFESLLTYIGFTLGLSTGATVVGLFRIRLQEGPALRVPGWPVLPALFLIGVAAITAFGMVQRPVASLAGLATLGLGAVAWRLGGRRPGQAV